MKFLSHHFCRGLIILLLLLTSCAPLVPLGPDPLKDSDPEVVKAADGGLNNEEPLTSSIDEPITAQQKLAQDIADLEQRQSDFNQQLTGLATPPQRVDSSRPAVTASTNSLTGRQSVSFNFDSADLLEVVRMFMGELLKQDYLVYPGVEGQVTMKINDQLNQGQIQHLLKGVLQINKMTMFQRDNRWHIMPLVDAPSGLGAGNLLLPQDAITRGQQIKSYRLEFVAVAELVKILTPYLSKGAQLYAHEATGVVLVCDYPHVLEKIGKLVTLFDVGPFAGMNMKVYWPQYVLSDELIKELDALAKSLSLADGNPNSRLSFLALPRLNLLLTMTRNPDLLNFVDMWIKELDRETPQALQQSQEDGIFIYPVQNGSAEAITDVLNGLFGSNTGQGSKAENQAEKLPTGTQLTRMFSSSEKSQTKTNNLPDAVSGTLGGPVTFVIDPVSNAVLIRSSAADYRKILPVIKKLDAYPKQALIEVTIAEIQLDEASKLGVEWQYLMNNVAGTDATGNLSVDSGLGTISASGESLIGSGLSYLLVNTGRFTAALKAFSNQNRVNVLSSPHILASDNQEARIDIGDEVPIVTSELRTTEATSTAITVDKSIQYRDVGILLAVTPHIHENGMVSMDISQVISEISTKTVGGTDSPVFSKRSANTSLSVRDGQTIVIAGLMKQTSSNGYSGVPFLARLPVLRYFFGYEGREYRNTELMIFITPHVILTEKDSEFISGAFLKRLDVIRAAMRF